MKHNIDSVSSVNVVFKNGIALEVSEDSKIKTKKDLFLKDWGTGLISCNLCHMMYDTQRCESALDCPTYKEWFNLLEEPVDE